MKGEGQVSMSSSSSSESEMEEELQRLVHSGPVWKNRKWLSKQLSLCETPRDAAWEKRRRQILRQQHRRNGFDDSVTSKLLDESSLTDEDFYELKGCIELGFGFNEEDGQGLCNTLPALDLYFAVNRQLSSYSSFSDHTTTNNNDNNKQQRSSSPSPFSTPSSCGCGCSPRKCPSSSLGSPRSDSDSWKICSPGDKPQLVKTKLRHWAQAVACSVMQSY